MTQTLAPLRRAADPVVAAVGPESARLLLRRLMRSQRRVGVALMYHSLAERSGDVSRELVPPHARRVFAAQVAYVRDAFAVVPAERLPDAVAERRPGAPFPLAITFDDDLMSHVSIALPVLKRSRCHATFFLSGASLDAPFSFWWERLQRAYELAPATAAAIAPGNSIHAAARRIQRLPAEDRDAIAERLGAVVGGDPPDAGLRREGVRALAAGGMAVGFHTRRHDPLTQLDQPRLESALHEGRDELEQVAGQSLRTIGYPHGLADHRVARAAQAAGFTHGFTGVPEPVHSDSEQLLLGRVIPSHRSVGHLAVQLTLAIAPLVRRAQPPRRGSA